MKTWLSAFITATLSMVLFSSISFAAGFRLPEQGAAAMGMSSAFVGQADDPSAVWYNPAGITQLDGTRIAGGFVAVYPYFSHENLDGTTDASKRDIHLPINFYVTNKVNDKISLGLGINNPFGLATDWSPTSETRYVATFTNIVVTEVNPNIAYKINNDLSVAAGITFIHLRATLEKLLDPAVFGPLGNADFRLAGDGDGWGANVAAYYKATEKLNVGLSYRSRVKVDINDGSANIATAIPGFSNSAKTDITLPDIAVLGASYKASDNLTLNADLDYTWWSTFDRLVVTSNTILALTGTTNTLTTEYQWKDVWALRIGGQYKLSDQWKLRAGYHYDQNPVQDHFLDTRLPDSDRQAVSIGAGYTVNKVTVDAAYQHIWFKKRTVSDSIQDDLTATPNSLNGTYKATVDSFALMVSYKF
jgi:long-chain fatty acid transport protein